MHIEVVYALSKQQHQVHVELLPGSTVGQALDAVARLSPFSELDLSGDNIGIYGLAVTRSTVLRPGDRVEIYRPLLLDPRQARKERVDVRNRRNNQRQSETE